MLFKKILYLIVILWINIVNAQNDFLHIKSSFSWLYLKPTSNNNAYASFVSGTQPYYQNWHLQTINPNYSSAFEVALESNLVINKLNSNASWLHFNSNDSSSIQGNNTTSPANIAFVGPLFEMSPPVFGIRRADAQLNYNYDDMNLNLQRLFASKESMFGKLIGGLKVLSIKQTFKTIFSRCRISR